MEDKDLILAEFQNFTGLEDLGECIAILEQHSWDLQEAVHNTIACLDSPPVPSVPSTIDHGGTESDAPARFGVDGGGFLPASFNHDSAFVSPLNRVFEHDHAFSRATGSSDSSPKRLLDFNIEYRDRNVPLVIPDSETVGKIKELLQEELLIPVAKQELHGWIHKNDSLIKDTDIIRDLKLPKKNSLFLLTPDLPLHSTAPLSNHETADQKTYELLIKNRDTGKEFFVKFPGSKTIGEVKIDVYPALDISVRHQVWSGWPDSVKDDKATLSVCGLDFPCHKLEVWSSHRSSSSSAAANQEAAKKPVEEDETYEEPYDVMEVESDLEAEAIDDMLYEPYNRIQSSSPLMHSNSEDATAATENFIRVFADRYGETHPVFYIGNLEEVLHESLQCKARDRKLLAIYLHHDSSILANVFCSQILCTETVVSFLSANFITWAWDLTHPSNKDILLRHCTSHFGSVAANTVRQFCPDRLPLLLVISRNRGSNEVVEVIDGSTTLNEIMMRLIHAVEMFKQQVASDIQEEDERDERERMLAEQDAAYQESLMLDRAKDEEKRREEKERQRLEDLEKEKKEQEEMRKQMEEEEKEAIRMSLANQLPEEPPANCTEPTTTFRIRCPDGQTLARRFYAHNPLAVLLDYITSEGYHVEEYKVLSTYPRRDLTQLDKTMTFDQLKIGRQETLTLEQLA